MNSTSRPHLVLMGQTPPPWHGQAVATKILFDHDWPDFEVHRVRMEYSEEMEEVGRFRWRKVRHLWNLTRRVRRILKENPDSILFYPPANSSWIPFLRDVVFLLFTRPLAGATAFIYHASGLPRFVGSNAITRVLGDLIYGEADLSLEVAQEKLPPHEAFAAKAWQWCPCGIEVPCLPRPSSAPGRPLEVLFVGSLQEGKGVLEILHTAAILRDNPAGGSYRFRIVGKWFSADFEEQARRLHAELGLGPIVEFSGQLTGDEKWQAYASADIFFFPTHYASEATPIVLMEALGMGLPIVSTVWAGIPAMLEGCATACLLPVRSPVDYAKALGELFAKRHQLAELAEEARSFYRDRFLPSRFIARVEKSLLGLDSRGRAKMDHSLPALASGKQRPLTIEAYLADQNPGHDRSFGISRMTAAVLSAFAKREDIRVQIVASATSQSGPESVASRVVLPWSTRNKLFRLLTDHLHPMIVPRGGHPDICYYPKGFLPFLSSSRSPKVVTIHDTILQYYWDHYPSWRNSFEYSYWARMLKHTLRAADGVLTVSNSSKQQILDFMARHDLPAKEIVVTYEPCLYEAVPQPLEPEKEDYVVHLASREPHKRTASLVRWWVEHGEAQGCPPLHLIGRLPPGLDAMAAGARNVTTRPFLEDRLLRETIGRAKALILPSEIEGFGLPAIEAYFLGTPVCHVAGTSVQEILGIATSKGIFSLEHLDSLGKAVKEVLAMAPGEIRECGLMLRAAYSSEKVADAMIGAFRQIRESHSRRACY